MVPPVVMKARVVFQSQTGEACCVAVDPELLTSSGKLVLDDLPAGPATVTIAGFSTDFAPTVPGITRTCRTVQRQGVMPCDLERSASPAYESAPLPVNIVPGARVDLGEVDVSSLPFVYAFSPAEGEAVAPPIQIDFTIVDAVTDIKPESVALEVTFEVAEGEPPVFRPITKRIPVSLTACEDGSAPPCSEEGNLDLAGFFARGAQVLLPEGPAIARITGENTADPPRDVDFRYSFLVLPEPTETVTPLPEAASGSAAAAQTASGGAEPPDADLAGGSSLAPDDAGRRQTSPGGAPAAEAVSGVAFPTPTPTATPPRAAARDE